MNISKRVFHIAEKISRHNMVKFSSKGSRNLFKPNYLQNEQRNNNLYNILQLVYVTVQCSLKGEIDV